MLRAARGIRYSARLLSRRLPGLGPSFGRRAGRVIQLDRPRVVTARQPPCAADARPRRSEGSGVPARLLGEPSGPQVRSTRVGNDQQGPCPPGHRAVAGSGQGRRRVRAAAGILGRPAGRAAGRHSRHRRQPDGEHLESVSVHGDLRDEPVGVAIRVGHRPWHRIQGLQPGHPRDSCTWPPSSARARLIDLASTQLPTGGAYHQYQPLTKRGNDDIGSGFNDDPLWLVLAVAAYLKETGDFPVLDETVPYDNAAGSETSLLRAPASMPELHHSNEPGRTGLPLIGRADWNDCLNLELLLAKPGGVVPDDREQDRRGSPNRWSSPPCSFSRPGNSRE